MSSAVILNGGRSSRLSVRNKGLLKVDGVTVIRRIYSVLAPLFDEVIVISNDRESLAGVLPQHVMSYPDEIEGKGPLGGIYTGLLKTGSDRAFFCPCDMPFLNAGLVKYLYSKSGRWDATCPASGGHIEPLHSVYKTACIPHIKELLDCDLLSVLCLYPMVRTRFVNVEKAPCETHIYDFMNINTWRDYGLAACIDRQLQ